MAHGHDQIFKKKKSLRFQDFFFILGLVAQRPKLPARQEALAVFIVSKVLESTCCLVWDSQWEGRNISAGRPPSFMFKKLLLYFRVIVSGFGILQLGRPFSKKKVIVDENLDCNNSSNIVVNSCI